jgi:hypothetical protein
MAHEQHEELKVIERRKTKTENIVLILNSMIINEVFLLGISLSMLMMMIFGKSLKNVVKSKVRIDFG